jgi:acyl carrier protein
VQETFSLADLRQLLIRCADLPAGLVLDDPAASLIDLGVDSVALVALQAELRQRYGIRLDESALPHLETAGGTVAYVNELIRRAA